MTDGKPLSSFGDFDPTEHAAEAQERWGATEAYCESTRRTAGYTEAEWVEMRREAADVNQAFLDLMAAGAPATSEAAAAAVDRHRDHISKWFYVCTPEIHTGLGQMYVDDARFTENIDQAGTGLARYMAEAIAARYQG